MTPDMTLFGGEIRMKNRYELRDNVAYIYDCNNECFIVDANEIDKIANIRWRCKKGTRSYVVGNSLNKKKVYLHRFIMGACDPAEKVDHINHDTRDNRKNNLRICTNRENSLNRINRDMEGVSYRSDRKRWRAYININYKQISLGHYKTEEEARVARMKAVEYYYGTIREVVKCPRKRELVI
ncbi:MAG: HNH endonuclease [Schwartzia sp.]|nr:HNH endonuclease [Schwartzia sp. (in: firmicutes)]